MIAEPQNFYQCLGAVVSISNLIVSIICSATDRHQFTNCSTKKLRKQQNIDVKNCETAKYRRYTHIDGVARGKYRSHCEHLHSFDKHFIENGEHSER